MSELQDMLRVQARLHRKQGANALGDLFQSAALEIEILTERLENPQGLQELICVEQMKEISLPEIHRANQKLHEQLAKANERVEELEGQIQLTMLTTHEESFESDYGQKRLSKFAIEKKIEALDEVESVYMQAAETSEPISFREAFDSFIEQLRKEQDSE